MAGKSHSGDRFALGVAVAILLAGGALTAARASSDAPTRRGELKTYAFFTVLCAGVSYASLRALGRRGRQIDHSEFTLFCKGGNTRMGALVERLAGIGRRVEVRVLDESGEPGEAPNDMTQVVGTQAQLRLAADQGPGRVLLRMRREADGSVFGLIEIEDDGSRIMARLAGDVVRELAALMPGLEYGRLGSTLEPLPAAEIETGEPL